MMFLLLTSSPLFFLLLFSGAFGAVPVHVIGTACWGFLITRMDLASYPAAFLLAELIGAGIVALGLAVLAALGEVGLAVVFSLLSMAHLLALDYSRRALARLLEDAPAASMSMSRGRRRVAAALENV